MSSGVDELADADISRGDNEPIVAHRALVLSLMAPQAVQSAAASVRAPAPATPAPSAAATARPEPSRYIEDTRPGAAPRARAVSTPDYLQFKTDDDVLDEAEPQKPEPEILTTPSGPTGWRKYWEKFKALSTVKKAGVIFGVCVVLLIAYALLKPKPTAPPLQITQAPSGTPPPAAAPPALANGKLKFVSAGPACKPGGTDPRLAIDGHNDTAWTCKAQFGLGQELTLELESASWVNQVGLIPGFLKVDKDADQWSKYSTVTKVLVQFDGDTGNEGITIETANAKKMVPMPINPPRLTKTIRITIKKVTDPPADPGTILAPGSEGNKARVFAISEIEAFGHPATPTGG